MLSSNPVSCMIGTIVLGYACAIVAPFLPFLFMTRFSKRLALTAMLLSVAMPASAKIYPDDFLIPGRSTPLPEEPAGTDPREEAEPTPGEPFFFASEIKDGNLNRAEFADAVATRLYDADTHDNCFAELVLSENYDYQLLYDDVSLDAPYASSICLTMRNGITQGDPDGNFRPNAAITVAEAAATFGDIGGLPLRDSNHVVRGEPWYQRYMDAMRAVDREFTMRPSDIFTGTHLRHSLCVLKRYTRALDPLGEFSGC